MFTRLWSVETSPAVVFEMIGKSEMRKAITMTAELSDAFRTKREGVAFVLDAAQAAFRDRPLRVLTTAGEPVGVEEARSRPWDVETNSPP